MDLADLGFSAGAIVETIVSTCDLEGTPNAAPMGVTLEDEQTLRLQIFVSSSTYQNLQDIRCAVINLTSDINLFYQTTFKDTNPNGKLPPSWFAKAQTVAAPVLCAADACLEVCVCSICALDEQRVTVFCTVKHIDAPLALPLAYCRAFGATLEAIIHATRIQAYIQDPTKQQELAALLQTVNECGEVVAKVAPDSVYSQILEDINGKISSWRSNP
ncbi:MAG: DUF447 family protein [Candidatus Bathyarchaeota archaeon]|nr:DUF447 family protein [Candidatus Bathyarchaeota archaeon]